MCQQFVFAYVCFCIPETCVCDDGWGHQNCLVNLSMTVETSDITGGGKCDLSTDGNCDHVIVVSDTGLIPAVSAAVLVKKVGNLVTLEGIDTLAGEGLCQN